MNVMLDDIILIDDPLSYVDNKNIESNRFKSTIENRIKKSVGKIFVYPKPFLIEKDK